MLVLNFIRDHAMYAAIFGLFGAMWFGWAQENPPKTWRLWLGLGSAASVALMIAGIYLALKHWHDASALGEQVGYWIFGVIVLTEFTSAGIGAFLLARQHKQQYISAWVAFVVGIHFLPLAGVFNDDSLYILSALVCMAPIFAALMAKKLGIAVSAITGASVGLILLGFAARGLILVFM